MTSRRSANESDGETDINAGTALGRGVTAIVGATIDASMSGASQDGRIAPSRSLVWGQCSTPTVVIHPQFL
jgi:hypothetical protein